MYGLCRSCVFFRDEYKTPTRRSPRHCVNPEVSAFFGESNKGFISGTDIFYCDYFQMHHFYCGDVLFKTKRGGQISYVINKDRKKRKQFKLTDNSKNIKIVYEQQCKSRHLEEDSQGRNSRPFGSDGCPF